jgi:hypothetical protein
MPVALMSPTTVKVLCGVVVPMPRLPAWVRVKSSIPVEEAMAKGLVPPLPWTNNVVIGVIVPMPTRSVEVAL